MYRITTHCQSELLLKRGVFKDCLKMLMEMAGSRSCGGRAFQDNGLDEENAREPNVDVDVRVKVKVTAKN